MKKVLVAAALVFATLGCGVENPSDTGRAVTSHHEALCNCGAIPPAPRMPTVPTDFRRYLASGQPLFAPTVKSAYTVVFRDDVDPTRLNAWGFDVVSGACSFLVSLDASDYPVLTSVINQEIYQYVSRDPGSTLSDGIAGQINLPNPPPHGTLPWEMAFQMSALHP